VEAEIAHGDFGIVKPGQNLVTLDGFGLRQELGLDIVPDDRFTQSRAKRQERADEDHQGMTRDFSHTHLLCAGKEKDRGPDLRASEKKLPHIL
jgi:hypothetical protein